VLPSLWLWLPYPIYAENHRRHHATQDLTIPGVDPESFYWSAHSWRQAGPLRRSIASFNQTLCGRMLLGPLLSVLALIKAELGLLARGDFRHLGHWILHVLVIAPLLYWLIAVCGISLLKYLLCFALPGTSLALIRSFCETVPARSRTRRTRAVEDKGPLAWLFLFNNLHVLHHRTPETPWYALPAIYDLERGGFLKHVGQAPIEGYGEVFRRYFWRRKDSPISPNS
jgi:fatty acid desaturase